MSKEITIDYSDNESLETEAPIFQTTRYNSAFKKVQLIEQQIKALENQKKNKDLCKICNVELKSLIHAKTHYISLKHKNNLELLRQRLAALPIETLQDNIKLENFCIPNSAVSNDKIEFHCNMCNITLVGKWAMDNHQNAETHKRNLERYCDICHVRTTSKEALLEHVFFSHRQELQRSNLVDDGPSIPTVYVSPKITPKKSLKVTSNTQTGLQPNVTWNCDICYEKFETERLLISHKKTFPHVILEQFKLQYRPEVVDAVCSINSGLLFCSLCNVKMKSLTDTQTHFNSTRHVKRFEKLLEDLSMKENNTGLDNFEIENRNQNQEVHNEYKINIAETKTEEETWNEDLENNLYAFYCYLCKMEFDTEEQISIHATCFPHVQVANLKSELISLGVPYAEYWVQSQNNYCCTLCDAQIMSEKASEQHCSSLKHRQRLNLWTQQFSTWKCGPVVDPKYFHCKICNVFLTGTTEAELHYKMPSHLEKVERYSESGTPINSTEEILLQEHVHSLAHQENKSEDWMDVATSKTYEDRGKVDNQDNSDDKNLNTPEDKNSLQPSDISLKQQVYKELEKLVDTLYYSNSLPYDVSLKYVKKMNKDIRKLKWKYQVRAGNSLEKEDGKNQTINDENKDVLYDNTRVKPEQNIGLDVDDIDISKNVPAQTEVESKTIVKPKSKKKKKYAVGNVEDTTYTSKEEDDKTEFEDHVNFKDMLERLHSKITECDTYRNPELLALLNELESLIKFIDSGEIQPGVILGFLRNCNEELLPVVAENVGKTVPHS